MSGARAAARAAPVGADGPSEPVGQPADRGRGPPALLGPRLRERAAPVVSRGLERSGLPWTRSATRGGGAGIVPAFVAEVIAVTHAPLIEDRRAGDLGAKGPTGGRLSRAVRSGGAGAAAGGGEPAGERGEEHRGAIHSRRGGVARRSAAGYDGRWRRRP